MKNILDTNVLVRILLNDNVEQAALARPLLTATQIFVPITAICELCWVLRARYHFGATEVRAAIEALLARPGIVTDRSAAAIGLAFLEAGADFADGVIAATGASLGGDTFISFDQSAVGAAKTIGLAARQP